MTELDRFVIGSSTALTDARDRLAAVDPALLVVVDDGAVVGTLTDGQLRRAALRDHTLSGRVGDVMSRAPVVAGPAESDAHLAGLLDAYRLAAIPVVDGSTLRGLRFRREFAPDRPRRPVAVLMVGGRGERLRPLTDKVPKPLIKIGAISIVERLIAQLAAADVATVYLAVNYLAEQFEEQIGDGTELGVAVRYLREERPMASAGALSLLPEVPPGPVIVANGDLVTSVPFDDLLEYHWHHGGAITVCGVEHLTHVPYGVLRTAEHHLLSIEEKPDRRDLVSAGIYVLEPEVLRFVPPNTPMTIPDLIDDAVGEGLPVNVFPVLESWFDIGSPAELERVMLRFATGEQE